MHLKNPPNFLWNDLDCGDGSRACEVDDYLCVLCEIDI